MFTLFNFPNFNYNNNLLNCWNPGSYALAQNFGFNTFCLNISNFLGGNIVFFDVNMVDFNKQFTSNNFNISVFNNNFVPNYSNYNFNTNIFGLPSSSVKSASVSQKSKSEVKYLNWRNLDDAEMRKIFGNYDYDVTQNFNGTADDLNKFLEKYPNSKLRGQGQIFIDAQNKYGISALVLLAICGAETSYGTKGIAVERNNFVNIEKEKNATYDGRWRKFKDAKECIMELARLLKQNYVESPGNGKVDHLKKLYQIAPKYCPAKEDGTGAGWAKLVDSCMNNITKTINA